MGVVSPRILIGQFFGLGGIGCMLGRTFLQSITDNNLDFSDEISLLMRAVPLPGVKVVSLKVVRNERGYLQEVQRNDDDHFPGYGSSYITCTVPGITKGWY